jgi:hypothetical protein
LGLPAALPPRPGRLNLRELFVEARSQTYVVQFRITGQDS